VGYLVRRYPVLSETFVALEVSELRLRGVRVTVLAGAHGGVGGAEPGTVHLRGGKSTPRVLLAVAHVRWAVLHPRRYARAHSLVRAAGVERGDCDWRRLAWAATQLRRSRVEVLHAHFAWSAAAQAWALAVLLDVPWVLTVHARDMYVEPVRLPEKLAAANAVVTVCHYNEDHLRADHGFTGPIHQIICGVRLPASVHRAGADERHVVAVGRLVEKKGFDILVRAAALLPSDVTVTIYGDGPERGRLLALAASLGNRVAFPGAVDHPTVLEAVGQAAALCLPARIAADGDRDSMPVVVKEAMARAVPVVVTDVAALPEMVDDRVGWVVPPDDVDALAGALADLLAHPSEAARRGVAGRARVESSFRVEDQMDRLLRIFESVVTA
jgi:colanic acid/amylovoran biosynthesis glycosyltransferase